VRKKYEEGRENELMKEIKNKIINKREDERKYGLKNELKSRDGRKFPIL
jgi:hypothetical protein